MRMPQANLNVIGITFNDCAAYTNCDYRALASSSWTAEVLHNFGLFHSSKDTTANDICACHTDSSVSCGNCHSEYGDYSSCMGRGDVCPNAVEAYRVQWVNAIETLTSSNMGVGQIFSYTIPPLDSSSTPLVVVRPSWASTYKFNLYFSTRRSSGGDSGISSTFRNSISVHSIDKDIDLRGSNENADIHILRTVSANTRQVFSAQKVVLDVGTVANDGSIGITLCRYSSSDSHPPAAPEGQEYTITKFLRKTLAGATVLSGISMRGNDAVAFASGAKNFRTATSEANEFNINDFWTRGKTVAVAEAYGQPSYGVSSFSYSGTELIAVNDFLGNTPASAEPLLALDVASAYHVELLDQGCVMGGKSISKNQPGQACRVFRGQGTWDLDSDDNVANWLVVSKSANRLFISNVVVELINGLPMAYVVSSRLGGNGTPLNKFTAELAHYMFKKKTRNQPVALGWGGPGVGVATVTYTQATVMPTTNFLPVTLATAQTLYGVGSSTEITMVDDHCMMAGRFVNSKSPGSPCRVFLGTQTSGGPHWIAAYHRVKQRQVVLARINTPVVDGVVVAYVADAGYWSDGGKTLASFDAATINSLFSKKKNLKQVTSWGDKWVSMPSVGYQVTSTDPPPCEPGAASSQTCSSVPIGTDFACSSSSLSLTDVISSDACASNCSSQEDAVAPFCFSYNEQSGACQCAIGPATAIASAGSSMFYHMLQACSTAYVESSTVWFSYNAQSGACQCASGPSTFSVSYFQLHANAPSVQLLPLHQLAQACSTTKQSGACKCSSRSATFSYMPVLQRFSYIQLQLHSASCQCSLQEDAVPPFSVSYNAQSGACQCASRPATAIASARLQACSTAQGRANAPAV
eukprot:gene28661-31838_t